MPSIAKDDVRFPWFSPTSLLRPRLISEREQAALKKIGLDHLASGMGRKWDHLIIKGEGLVVTMEDGTQKLDFTAGIGVVRLGICMQMRGRLPTANRGVDWQTNLGHCHPKVTAAVQKQVGEIVHVQCGECGLGRVRVDHRSSLIQSFNQLTAIGMHRPYLQLGQSPNPIERETIC